MAGSAVRRQQQSIISGFKFFFVLLGLRYTVLRAARRCYRGPRRAVQALKLLMARRRLVQGGRIPRRCVKAGGRYFFGLNLPGWPSPAFRQFIEHELNLLKAPRDDDPHLQTLIFAVTKRCPLSCEHCFEWSRLQDPETLSLEDLLAINRRFQAQGISQIQISGGEPLVRLEDVLSLLESAVPGTDYWLLTSGYQLTASDAARLRTAGLTGVNISLDHWDPAAHNAFRGHPEAFAWVEGAAASAIEAGLALCVTLCATRAFVTAENLRKYLKLAQKLQAGFIQILEPRRVGRYQEQEVELTGTQLQLLTDFFLETNSARHAGRLPIVTYPGYHQRQQGCFGAGVRYLYVDTDGDLHACPFCQEKQGNCLTEPTAEIVQRIKARGCHQFETVSCDF